MLPFEDRGNFPLFAYSLRSKPVLGYSYLVKATSQSQGERGPSEQAARIVTNRARPARRKRGVRRRDGGNVLAFAAAAALTKG
jgi:hypothetical protein